jgi:GDPmannose 4,6-dehydratase
MRTAIVFGVTGQDGSYLAELLLEKNYRVIGVSRRSSTNNTERLTEVIDNNNFIFKEGDITDAFCVSNLIMKYKPEEIYNLAAQSHVGTSFTQASLTWDITAKGCLNILEAIIAIDNTIKFYQASSSEMFGSNLTERDGEKFQDELTPFKPNSPYAVAKLAAHDLVRVYRESYNLHGSCGILFNHESERRGEKFVTRKITKWIGELVGWEKKHAIDVPITNDRFTCSEGYEDIGIPQERMFLDAVRHPSFPKLRLGNLDSYRDWGHAEDYVHAMWLMLQQDVPDDYVIATGEAYSIRNFLEEAFQCINIKYYEQYVVIDPKFFRPCEVPYLRGSYCKAKDTLGWTPNISFSQLVQRMVKNDIQNYSRYIESSLRT